jgi:glycosyltransferase involved in cell wall biosynthesis
MNIENINTAEKINLSIIIPCLNEERNIYSLLFKTFEKLEKENLKFEIIVINDGSSDNTLIEAKKFVDPRLFIISNEKNLGFGGSFWVGIKAAKGSFVTMIPGDGQILIDDIADMFWLTNHVDMIVPFIVNRSIRSLKRRLISRLYNSVINLSFGLTLNYTNGNVIYRSSILKSMKPFSKSFFFQTEILVAIIKSKYLYAEVPVKLNAKDAESSGALKLKSICKVIFDYFRLLYCFLFRKKNILLQLTNDSITKKKLD